MSREPHHDATPCDWLVTHAAIVPGGGEALDVACGAGRHALWLAGHGLHVDAVDRNPDAIAALGRVARDKRLPISARVVDLETPHADLGLAAYDVIVVVHYLHRALFPALIAALRPNGLLIYETFTRAQARRGKPTNPAFLLEPGELKRLAAGLEVVDWREGEFEGRDVASLVGRKAG